MTKPYIVGAILVAAAVIALVQLIRSRTNRVQPEPGFRDFVKNPDLWQEMIAANQETNGLVHDASSWDSEQVASQVKRYVFATDTRRQLWGLGLQLRELSPKTNEVLLRILNDKALAGRLAVLQQGDLLEDAPVMRVCELFNGHMPLEAIGLLEPYVSHKSVEIRKACGHAIARSGLPEALPAIKQALADEDEYVRSYALRGVRKAIESGKLSNEIRSGVVADLERLVNSELNAEDAARLMSQIDPVHAESFLLSDSVLDTQKHRLHEVLRVIGEFDFKIQRGTLNSLIDTYTVREMTYPNTYALGESLALLGKFRAPDDEQVLNKYGNHKESRVSEGAARGLLAFHKLEDSEERIWEQEQSGGWESLNKHQQMYVAVFWLDSEVNNGGHSQYFFNSFGDNWKLALDGLRAMGFEERLEIFDGVLSLFGSHEPFTDRDKRQNQLANTYTKHEKESDRFDSAWYQATENVKVFCARYVIQNADQFRH